MAVFFYFSITSRNIKSPIKINIATKGSLNETSKTSTSNMCTLFSVKHVFKVALFGIRNRFLYSERFTIIWPCTLCNPNL